MSDTFVYLKSDYSSQKAALIQRVRNRFPGVWNDFLQGSFGTMIIDIVSWANSTTAYTINRLAAENYIPTMSLRESAVRFGVLVGYNLRGATPSTVACEATLVAVTSADVTLLKGTPVRSGDVGALTFELDQDYTILAGALTPLSVACTFDPGQAGIRNVQALVAFVQDSVNVDCLDLSVDLRQFVQVGQLIRLFPGGVEYEIIAIEVAPLASNYNRMVIGVAWADETQATTAQVIDRRVFFVQGQTQDEQLTTPQNTAAYTYKLIYPSVIDGTVSVAVNESPWTQIDYLVNAAPDQEVYQVRTLPTGETIVMFGDGLFGSVLPSEATVAITYRTGGGSAGNINSGLIAASITGVVVSLSAPVIVTITNDQPGSGGLDPETLDQARARIPAFVRTNDRAVTLEDYQTLAVAFSAGEGQVRYARATVRTANALLEGNVVVLYAWTTGPDNALVPLSGTLKAALGSYLQTKAVGTDYVLIADGDATEFPFSSRFKAVPGYDVAAVEDAVLAATSAYITSLAPGASAVYSILVTQLAAVPGVLAITVATPDQDLAPDSDSTVFTPPTALPSYLISPTSIGAGAYTAQAPTAPLQAWGITAVLNGTALAVTADTTPGFARLSGGGLDPTNTSLVNLQTGLITFYTTGPVDKFEFGFVSVRGYNRDRMVDLYVGYTGDTSLAKRREIRSNLRVWAAGLPVGSTLFADEVIGAPTSVVSARAVVEAISGITEVTRVSLDAPANTAPRVDVGEFELAQVRNIYINNLLD